MSSDHCSCCKLPLQIVKVCFRLSGAVMIRTCPNCALLGLEHPLERASEADILPWIAPLRRTESLPIGESDVAPEIGAATAPKPGIVIGEARRPAM